MVESISKNCSVALNLSWNDYNFPDEGICPVLVFGQLFSGPFIHIGQINVFNKIRMKFVADSYLQ